MTGLGAQLRKKRARDAVNMSPTAEELATADRWKRPDPSEINPEDETYKWILPGEGDTEQLHVRFKRVALTHQLVEFSITQTTRWNQHRCEVAEADSCHDVDVHLHQNGRKAGGRIGTPTSLLPIRSLDDVQVAYEVAHDYIEKQWGTLKDRWHNG